MSDAEKNKTFHLSTEAITVFLLDLRLLGSFADGEKPRYVVAFPLSNLRIISRQYRVGEREPYR